MKQSGRSFCLFLLPEYPDSCFLLFPTTKPADFASRIYRLRHKNKLVNPNCAASSKFSLCIQCDLHHDSRRCLVNSCASKIHACFVFGILLYSPLFNFLKPGTLLCFLFAKQCRTHGNYQLNHCNFDGFSKFLLSSGSIK